MCAGPFIYHLYMLNIYIRCILYVCSAIILCRWIYVGIHRYGGFDINFLSYTMTVHRRVSNVYILYVLPIIYILYYTYMAIYKYIYVCVICEQNLSCILVYIYIWVLVAAAATDNRDRTAFSARASKIAAVSANGLSRWRARNVPAVLSAPPGRAADNLYSRADPPSLIAI